MRMTAIFVSAFLATFDISFGMWLLRYNAQPLAYYMIGLGFLMCANFFYLYTRED